MQVNTEIRRYKLDFEMFGYSPEEFIKMGKPGPDDVVEDPVAKEEESKSENPKEEVAGAEKGSEVESGLAEVEIGDEMKESEVNQEESKGESTT